MAIPKFPRRQTDGAKRQASDRKKVGGAGVSPLTVKHSQGRVFGVLHCLALLLRLVVDAAEVQDAVDDDAVQFLFVGGAEQFGIGAHGVQGNVGVAREEVALAGIEAYVVGVAGEGSGDRFLSLVSARKLRGARMEVLFQSRYTYLAGAVYLLWPEQYISYGQSSIYVFS